MMSDDPKQSDNPQSQYGYIDADSGGRKKRGMKDDKVGILRVLVIVGILVCILTGIDYTYKYFSVDFQETVVGEVVFLTPPGYEFDESNTETEGKAILTKEWQGEISMSYVILDWDSDRTVTKEYCEEVMKAGERQSHEIDYVDYEVFADECRFTIQAADPKYIVRSRNISKNDMLVLFIVRYEVKDQNSTDVVNAIRAWENSYVDDKYDSLH